MNVFFEPFNLSGLVNNLEVMGYRKALYEDEEEKELNQNSSYYHFLIFSAIKSRGKNNKKLIELCDRFGYELLLVIDEVPVSQIWKYKSEINWKAVSKKIPLKRNILETFGDRLDWKNIIKYQEFDYDLILNFQDKIDSDVLINRIDNEKSLPDSARLKIKKSELLNIYNFAISKKYENLA